MDIDILDDKGHVKSAEKLGEFVKAVQHKLTDIETVDIKAVAEDLKAVHAQVKEVQQDTARALAAARDAAIKEVALDKVQDDDLRALNFNLNAADLGDGMKEFRAISNPAFNVLMASPQHLAALPERTREFAQDYRRQLARVQTVHAYMHAMYRAKGGDYMERGGYKSLKCFDRLDKMNKRLAAAMDTSEAGAGLEWVPTGVGSMVVDDIRPQMELVAYIPEIPMPRNPYLYPVRGSHFKAYRVPEATGNTTWTSAAGNTAIGKRDLQTVNMTFDAEKLAAMVLASTEMDEDSIVALVPAIREDMAFAITATVEDVWINGQDPSAPFDTGRGVALSADDPLGCWLGLRHYATLTSQIRSAAAGLIVNNFTDLKGDLRRWGKSSSLVWATGYIGWAKTLTLTDKWNNSLLLTLDKAGAMNVMGSGTMGALLGSPFVVCEDWPENLNDAGIYDGVTQDYTSIAAFDRRAFRHGVVRLTTIEASRDWAFEFDQLAFRVTYRADGQPTRTPSSTWRSVGLIPGVAIA